MSTSFTLYLNENLILFLLWYHTCWNFGKGGMYRKFSCSVVFVFSCFRVAPAFDWRWELIRASVLVFVWVWYYGTPFCSRFFCLIPVEMEMVLVRHLIILGGSLSFASCGKSSKNQPPPSLVLAYQAVYVNFWVEQKASFWSSQISKHFVQALSELNKKPHPPHIFSSPWSDWMCLLFVFSFLYFDRNMIPVVW